MKKLTLAILPFATVGLNNVTQAATTDGKTIGLSTGWLNIMPQSKAQGVNGHTGSTPYLGALANLQSANPNAGFEVRDADTAGLMLDYYVNDHISVELALGAPPKIELSGKGSINIHGTPLIDLYKFAKAATTDAYTPTVFARYHFGTPEDKIRPYVGAGFMYAHFSNVETNPKINDALKATRIGAFNPKLGKVDVDDAVAPVAMLGVDYKINKDWYATASISYAYLSTTAKLKVKGLTPSGETTLISGKSNIEINPLVTYIGIGYRF